jgi:Na+/phosphate symporter
MLANIAVALLLCSFVGLAAWALDRLWKSKPLTDEERQEINTW